MADTTPTTQKLVTTLGATVVKNVLMLLGSSLAAHGVMSGSNVETFVAIGMAFVGAAWSFWNSYGRAIVLAKLEVWKATAQAQAEALNRAKVPAPTAAQIADKIPNPKVTAETVAKVMTAGCLLIAFVLLAGPALAQTKPGFKLPIPIGQPRTDATDGASSLSGSNSGLKNILTAFDDKLLPDLQFALNIAEKSGNKTTAACWTAWIDRINARKTANIGPDGQPLAPPDPHVITDFQKLMDLRNSLQPDSPFMLACQPIASIVKRDIVNLIGLVIGGGAGLAGLVPGL